MRDVAASGVGEAPAAPADQAVQALVNLGYQPGEAERAVRTAVASDGAGETVDLIRGALQLLSGAKR